MKESVLRAAAIAALALALIMSVTTWVGLSTSSHRGSFLVGFFEFALILFLGVVAWALFNALADIVTVRSSADVLSARMRRIEEALGVEVPEEPAPVPASKPRTARRSRSERGARSETEAPAESAPGAQADAQADAQASAPQDAQSNAEQAASDRKDEPPARTQGERRE